MNTKNSTPGDCRIFAFAVFLAFFLNLVLFPQWALPGLGLTAGYLLAALYVFFSAAAWYSAKRFAFFAEIFPLRGAASPACGDLKFTAAFGFISFLTHIPYLFLPLTTLGDAHMHAGLPALSWARLASAFEGFAGFGPRLLTAPALTFAAAGAFYYLKKLKRAGSPAGAVHCLLAAGAVYAVLALNTGFFEKFGPMEHLLRYPLLGKLVYFTGYSVFGIHEWVGRAAQLAFFFAGAVYFKKLLRLVSSRTAARCGYAAFLLFPPFWNYGHHNYLEAGVLFFAAAVVYYLVSFLKSPSRDSLFPFAAVSLLAVMYKEYLPGLIPVSAAVAALFHFTERRLGKRELLAVAGALSFPAFLTLQYLLSFDYLRGLYDYYPSPVRAQDLFSLGRLSTSLWNIPRVAGFPAALLSAAGITAGLAKWRSGTLYLLAWFLVLWILMSASTGFAFPRTNLIFYIPIPAFIGFLAGSVKRFARFMPAAVLVLMGWVSLFAGPGEGVPTGETISLGKIGKNIYPYHDLFKYISEKELFRARIYAPMVCEPSHFYMAKYGIIDDSFLDRRGWKGRAAAFREFLEKGGYEYVAALERGPAEEAFRRFISAEIEEDAAEAGVLELESSFRGMKGNTIHLYRVSRRRLNR